MRGRRRIIKKVIDTKVECTDGRWWCNGATAASLPEHRAAKPGPLAPPRRPAIDHQSATGLTPAIAKAGLAGARGRRGRGALKKRAPGGGAGRSQNVEGRIFDQSQNKFACCQVRTSKQSIIVQSSTA